MKNKYSWFTVGVLFMGMASFFSDLGHEISSSFIKLGAGWYSDRTGYRKPIAFVRYLITGLALGGFGFARNWLQVLLGRSVGWIGRGIRTPVRDAMLADVVVMERCLAFTGRWIPLAPCLAP